MENNKKNNYIYIGFVEAMTKVKRYEKRRLKESGINITPKEMLYLSIAGEPGNISFSDIQKRMDTSKGTVSNMLTLLTKKGFVTQTVDKSDKRIKIIKPTTKGNEAIELNNDIRERIKNYIFSRVTREEWAIFEKIALKLK